jgi:hypothetical protein
VRSLILNRRAIAASRLDPRAHQLKELGLVGRRHAFAVEILDPGQDHQLVVAAVAHQARNQVVARQDIRPGLEPGAVADPGHCPADRLVPARPHDDFEGLALDVELPRRAHQDRLQDAMLRDRQRKGGVDLGRGGLAARVERRGVNAAGRDQAKFRRRRRHDPERLGDRRGGRRQGGRQARLFAADPVGRVILENFALDRGMRHQLAQVRRRRRRGGFALRVRRHRGDRLGFAAPARRRRIFARVVAAAGERGGGFGLALFRHGKGPQGAVNWQRRNEPAGATTRRARAGQGARLTLSRRDRESVCPAGNAAGGSRDRRSFRRCAGCGRCRSRPGCAG